MTNKLNELTEQMLKELLEIIPNASARLLDKVKHQWIFAYYQGGIDALNEYLGGAKK